MHVMAEINTDTDLPPKKRRVSCWKQEQLPLKKRRLVKRPRQPRPAAPAPGSEENAPAAPSATPRALPDDPAAVAAARYNDEASTFIRRARRFVAMLARAYPKTSEVYEVFSSIVQTSSDAPRSDALDAIARLRALLHGNPQLLEAFAALCPGSTAAPA